jgi:hypothetical protein
LCQQADVSPSFSGKPGLGNLSDIEAGLSLIHDGIVLGHLDGEGYADALNDKIKGNGLS